MILLRSLLYQLLFIVWTLALGVLYLPLLLGRRFWVQWAARLWVRGAVVLQRGVLGLRVEVRGRENVPAGAALYAVKHQSAWETLIFHALLRDPTFILKRELLRLPVIGWYLWKSGQIAIDRAGGMKALKDMIAEAKAAAARGQEVIIFPEGHRQPPGVTGDFHPGVALLYAELDMPLVPVALNSGLFWGRNALRRRPGTIVLEFLPPVPRGLDRRKLMARLKDAIGGATTRLEAEAAARQPALRSLLPAVDKSVDDPQGPSPSTL